MDVTAYLRQDLARLHDWLERALADLPVDLWHAVPAQHPRLNTIAFEVWHYARTEDNIVRFILQGRRPTVWMEGRWAERFNLPPVAQGTGMPVEDAHGLRIDDLDGFRDYREQVWRSTDEFLATVDPADLEKMVVVKPFGEITGVRALGQVCLTHGFTHLGEIEVIRTLLGIESSIGL